MFYVIFISWVTIVASQPIINVCEYGTGTIDSTQNKTYYVKNIASYEIYEMQLVRTNSFQGGNETRQTFAWTYVGNTQEPALCYQDCLLYSGAAENTTIILIVFTSNISYEYAIRLCQYSDTLKPPCPNYCHGNGGCNVSVSECICDPDVCHLDVGDPCTPDCQLGFSIITTME